MRIEHVAPVCELKESLRDLHKPRLVIRIGHPLGQGHALGSILTIFFGGRHSPNPRLSNGLVGTIFVPKIKFLTLLFRNKFRLPTVAFCGA